MKLKPRAYFILSAAFITVFVVQIALKTDFIKYGFLGAAIGALIRGFYEESKERKSLKNNNNQ